MDIVPTAVCYFVPTTLGTLGLGSLGLTIGEKCYFASLGGLYGAALGFGFHLLGTGLYANYQVAPESSKRIYKVVGSSIALGGALGAYLVLKK